MGNSNSGQIKVMGGDRMLLGIRYEQGMKVADLARKYGVTPPTVYAILNEPDVREVREKYRETSLDRMWQAFDRNDKKIDSIIDKYIEEAEKDSRIKETDLAALFKVFNTLVQNKIKLKELTLKEHELGIKKQLLEPTETQDDGLIKDFLMVLDKKNSMKYLDSDDGTELDDDDTDDDVKQRSITRTKKKKKKKR